MEMLKDALDFCELYNYGKSKTNNDFFEKNGYLVIKNLWDPKDLFCCPPNERGMITYFGKLSKFRHNPHEAQVPGSLSRYSYPPYKFFHSQIRLKIEKEIGKKLFNTYYYDRFYFENQELKKHCDRESCEISLTFHVSSNIEKPWPIWIKTPDTYDDPNKEPEDRKIISKGKEVQVCLNPGDGLLYKGCERPHWRNAMPQKYNKIQKLLNKIKKIEDDSYYHQVFFHYVLADGRYSHFAGDNR